MNTYNKQYIVALIDRSGSMRGKESDTVNGINSMLEELKKDKKQNENIFVSIYLFDHELIKYCNNINIDNIELLKESDFKPRGQTALLDNLAILLQRLIDKKKRQSYSFDNCLLYVVTDGQENASKNFTRTDVKAYIEDAKKLSINVLYLGANQDAFLEAESMGIHANATMNYHETHETIENAYLSVARLASRTRSLGMEPTFLPVERSSSIIDIPPQITRQISNENLRQFDERNLLMPLKVARSRTGR